MHQLTDKVNLGGHKLKQANITDKKWFFPEGDTHKTFHSRYSESYRSSGSSGESSSDVESTSGLQNEKKSHTDFIFQKWLRKRESKIPSSQHLKSEKEEWDLEKGWNRATFGSHWGEIWTSVRFLSMNTDENFMKKNRKEVSLSWMRTLARGIDVKTSAPPLPHCVALL